MSPISLILIDVNNGVHKGDFSATSHAAIGSGGYWRVSQRILKGGLCDGVELLEIDNGAIKVFIIPTRGMGIWKLEDQEESLGWKSPVRGPVHPKFVPICEPSGLGWLDGYDELVVRCGLESNGPPVFDNSGRLAQPLHGRIANRPAHFLQVAIDENAKTISVKGIVEESRFHFQKLRLTTTITTEFNSRRIIIADQVENYGGVIAEMQMLYHINIGQPFLDGGSWVVVDPTRTVTAKGKQTCPHNWTSIEPPMSGLDEECYFISYPPSSLGRVLLKNSKQNGVVVTFEPESLPCFTVWKNTVAESDGYVVGLEPATNFPNPRVEEKSAGRVVSLLPGEAWSTQLSIDWLIAECEIAEVEKAILT